MSAMLLAAAVASLSVRPERVEGRPAMSSEGRPSTSSGRSEGGSAIDAERAFAADARTIGQWTAFRKWAAADAKMFAPQAVNAQEWLKERADPSKAIEWWPTASWVSCDGKVAVNSGGRRRADGAVGNFTTVWQRQTDGSWRWVLHHDRASPTPRAPTAQPEVARAACTPPGLPLFQSYTGGQGESGGGSSPDRSLWWRWEVDRFGWRYIDVRFWDGDQSATVVSESGRDR